MVDLPAYIGLLGKCREIYRCTIHGSSEKVNLNKGTYATKKIYSILHVSAWETRWFLTYTHFIHNIHLHDRNYSFKHKRKILNHYC